MNKSFKNKKVLTPLPVNIYNGNRLLRSLYKFYYSIFKSQPQITGTFLEFGRFVWIHDQSSITKLHQSGSFGKGDLSRSDPTWLERNIQQNKASLEEITVERRRKRRGKDQVDNQNLMKPDQVLTSTNYSNVESFQLDLCEAFFLVYALNSLIIKSTNQKSLLSIDDCWSLFCKADNSFHVNYVVYHFYRSLGWVPKNGSKFGVDFVLYQSGPAFKHAEFAVAVLPLCQDKIEERKSWLWLLRLNRICSQVKKTLILCYVNVPHDIDRLNDYSIRQVIYKRWSPQKNRE
ncbi:tRNA intron endonuclease [Helicostylum pulchrum]|uniref:tRNA-splicing endonuclease subunit Sen2 n=1 Tax=Helicostylum pulchrum TaxID=562976 RepID=A0ABP9YH38_9FUNG|nr:tRNA intron endonuclease [Helicostylum pulchrum]